MDSESNLDGHGDWLKSSEGLSTEKVTNKSEFDEMFKKKKMEGRALVVKQNIQDMEYNNGSMLDNSETVYSD